MKERKSIDTAFDPDHLVFMADESPMGDFETKSDMFRAKGEIFESAYRLFPEIETGKKANAVIESMANYVQARELHDAVRVGREALEDLGDDISPVQRFDIEERIRFAEMQLNNVIKNEI